MRRTPGARGTLPCGWIEVGFETVFETKSDGGKKVKKRDYLPAGALAVVDQGEDYIGGWTNEEGMEFQGELPVLLFGDHTRRFKLLNRRFAIGADGIKVLRPRGLYIPRFSYWSAFTREIPDKGYSRHFQYLRKCLFLVPPIPEQHRIVAAIETQLTRLDAAVADLERVRANLKRARASVMKAAVEGRLVPTEAELARQEGRSYEPASVLLERILEERRRRHDEAQVGAKRKKKYRPPIEPDVEGLAELPKGWVWAVMDQLLVDIQAGKSFRCNPKQPDSGDVGIVKVSAVSWGEYDEDESKTVDDLSRIDDSLFIEPGDFLFSRANTIELVGACVIVQRTSRRIMLSDKILRFVTACGSINRWLLAVLRSLPGREQIEELATGNQNSMRNIGQARIRQITIPIPPMRELVRAGQELDRRLSVLDATEKTVDHNLQRCERLRQSILKRAFEGKLVPQDPNDEPASELLARIQAENKS